MSNRAQLSVPVDPALKELLEQEARRADRSLAAQARIWLSEMARKVQSRHPEAA